MHVEVEFLHGLFRGDPDGAACTGGNAHAWEWPPSPGRLAAAFVAADGTGDRCAVTSGDELEWLERLPPPTIHACSDAIPTPLNERMVVEGGGHIDAKKCTMEYVGQKTTVARPSARVAMRLPTVRYSWDIGDERCDDHIVSLRLRAERIGYLGSADSPVRVRILTGEQPEAQGCEYRPDPHGDIMLNVPKPGTARALDAMFEQWMQHGPSISRQHFPMLNRKEKYQKRQSSSTRSPLRVGSVVAWLRLDRPVSGRRVRELTALFKRAVLWAHERKLNLGEPDPALHGHVDASGGYDLARWLALPNVMNDHSDGRIHGLALWLPPEADDEVMRKAAAAAKSVTHLCDGTGFSVRAYPNDRGDSRPWAACPDRWEVPSCEWVTAFPIVHERRADVCLTEVAKWCEHAGYPSPVSFRSSRSPLAPGAVDLAPCEVHVADRRQNPYSHFRLVFAEPIVGPVAIGKGRQRGLGLCAPADSSPVGRQG